VVEKAEEDMTEEEKAMKVWKGKRGDRGGRRREKPKGTGLASGISFSSRAWLRMASSCED